MIFDKRGSKKMTKLLNTQNLITKGFAIGKNLFCLMKIFRKEAA
jgi:hypothetical protein